MNAKLRSILLSSALAAGALGLTLLPGKAEAYWVRFGFPGIVAVPPPVVYAPPPPVYYAPPVAYGPAPYGRPHRIWLHGYYRGPHWVPGHWAWG